MIDADRREQVANQCRAVAHMATALAKVHSDYEAMLRDPRMWEVMDQITDQTGRQTASFMEQLGNMLNAMDAVTEEDDWTKPVFEAAHRLFPVKPES